MKLSNLKITLRDLLKDKFVLGTFFLTAANFGGSFLNYLVHPILTRHLSISAYGDFQAMLSFTMILSVLSSVINTTLTKEISVLSNTYPEQIDALRRRAAQRFFLFGLAVFTLVVVFINPLNHLFKISESTILIIASINFLYSFPLVVNSAVLSGKQDFFALAINGLLGAFSRLLFIILFVVIFPIGLVGAAWAIGLAGIASYILSIYQVKRLKLPISPIDIKASLSKFWRYSLMVLWFMIINQLFYNFDMLLVKSFFSPEEAGLYGALLTIGRIIFFVGGAVPLVMFPVIANLKEDKSLRPYIVLGKSVLLLGLLAVPAYLIISIWPAFIIKVIVGSKYLPLVPYLPAFSLVMLALTLLTVLSNYFLALSSRRSIAILTITAIAEIILLSIFHSHFSDIISSLGVVFGGGSIALLSLAYFEYRKTKNNLYVQKN